MKKKKKYCPQRNLNDKHVKTQLLAAIFRFQEHAFDSLIKITSMSFAPLLSRLSVSLDAEGYFPHKGWLPIENSCFQGTFVAWNTNFSVRIHGEEQHFTVLYKIKSGECLVINAKAVQIKECVLSNFYVGKHRITYKGDSQYTER